MHQLASALAIAGTDEGVAFCRLIAQTYFARACQCLRAHLVHVFVELQVGGLFEGRRALAVSDLNHKVLYPAQLDVVAGLCMMALLHSG